MFYSNGPLFDVIKRSWYIGGLKACLVDEIAKWQELIYYLKTCFVVERSLNKRFNYSNAPQ